LSKIAHRGKIKDIHTSCVSGRIFWHLCIHTAHYRCASRWAKYQNFLAVSDPYPLNILVLTAHTGRFIFYQ
jgi:hypothetical protein